MAASSLTVMVQLQDQVTAPARQATKAVDNFTNSVQRSARGANQLGANMGKATRDTRKFAMTGMQQAGYQVGDFFVQVGMGQELFKKLLAKGIIIRPLDSYNLPEYVRITIGNRIQNDLILKMIKEEILTK